MACTSYSLSISQFDLDNATGNTPPNQDGVMYVSYYDCNGDFVTDTYSAGYFENAICNNDDVGFVSLYYYQNNMASLPSFSSVNAGTGTCEVLPTPSPTPTYVPPTPTPTPTIQGTCWTIKIANGDAPVYCNETNNGTDQLYIAWTDNSGVYHNEIWFGIPYSIEYPGYNTYYLCLQTGTYPSYIYGGNASALICSTEESFGSCFDDSVCSIPPSPTPTSTTTLTATPTRTPVITYAYLGKTTPDSANADNACNTYATVRPYYSTKSSLASITIGDIIYNSYPTTPTNGGNNWVALKLNGTGESRPIQIGTDGTVLDVGVCAPPPSPTPTSYCNAPTLNSVTLVSGSLFTYNYGTLTNCNALTLSYSRDQVTWSNDTGGCSTGRQRDTGDATGTWYFRLTQICIAGGTADSNIVSYVYPSPTPTRTATPTQTPTATPYTIFTGTGECNIAVNGGSGGRGLFEYTIQLGLGTGNVSFNFNAFSVPDQFQVYYNGSLVIDTGFRGDSSYNAQLNALGYPNVSGPGSGVTSFTKPNASPQTCLVVVTAPLTGTAWEFLVGCPSIPPTPTPTQTPTNTRTQTPTTTTTLTATPTVTPTRLEDGIWTITNFDCGFGSINDVGINGSFMNSLPLGPSTFPLTSTLSGSKQYPSGVINGLNLIQLNVTTNLPGTGNCAYIFVYRNGNLVAQTTFDSNPFPQIYAQLDTNDDVSVIVQCFGSPCPSPTPSVTASQTVTPSNTSTTTLTATQTPTPTNTQTPTNTRTQTPTTTTTLTATPTTTPTNTNTQTPTNTRTQTPTPTNTQTPTVTPTRTSLPCDINYSNVANEGGACGLYIQNIPPCQAGTLTAGSLASNSGCTVGTYVIDWYLNTTGGTASFTSGSAISAATDVTVVQPFTNEPVQGGTWYPVVRFAFLNGVKYTSNINLATSIVVYSPDLGTVVSPLCAESYNCSSGNSGSTYPVSISYTNTTQNATQAQRSISWSLSSINKYFAWRFYGYTVYDTISISYVSPSGNTTTQIENWVVGDDASTTNLTSNPKVYNPQNGSGINLGYLAMVTPLTGFTYTNGDYLLINITPNPTISNTNWAFQAKCLTDSSSLDCGSLFNGNFAQYGYNVSGIGASYNSSSCNLTVSGITRNGPTYTATTSNNNFFKYNGSYVGSSVGTTVISPATVNASVNAYFQYPYYPYAYCTNQNSSTIITKSGATITLTFNDTTDYNTYKTQYTNAANSPYITNYTGDSTNLNYYKYFNLGILSGTTCGDSLGVSYSYTTHITSPFTFDDVNKKITVVLSPGVNGLTSGVTCDNTYSTVQSTINSINSNIASSNYTITTYVRRGNSAYYTAVGSSWLYQYSSLTNYYADYAVITPKPNVCQSSISGFVDGTNYWISYPYYMAYTITNSSDPVNNFKVENYLNSSGVPGTLTLLYQKTNGVVVYP
jgi:hypothetical protein